MVYTQVYGGWRNVQDERLSSVRIEQTFPQNNDRKNFHGKNQKVSFSTLLSINYEAESVVVVVDPDFSQCLADRIKVGPISTFKFER